MLLLSLLLLLLLLLLLPGGRRRWRRSPVMGRGGGDGAREFAGKGNIMMSSGCL